jgi:FG-GAP repeat
VTRSRTSSPAPAPGGGPHVIAFSGANGSIIASFFAYGPGFTGGARVATADTNGDGRLDILTGAGPGGGPHVRAFDGVTLAELDGFFPFNPAFTGGVQVGGHRQ